MKKQKILSKGFTLIEILIVMVIIGIIVTFAAIAVGDFGGERKLFLFGEKIQTRLLTLRYVATLKSQLIGVAIANEHIIFLNYTKDHWQVIDQGKPYHAISIPSLYQLSTQQTTEPDQPFAIIMPNGEMSVFQLTLCNQDRSTCYTIENTGDSQISLNKAKQNE